MGTLYSEINRRHFAMQVTQEDSATRLDALDALVARGDTELLLPKALGLLSDSDEIVRRRASEAIARLGTKEAAEATVDTWETFNQDGLDAAVDALADLGRPAIAATRKQLQHGNPAIRAAASTALGRMDARTVDGELAVALADPDPRVVCAAAQALGQHRAERHLEDLTVVFRRKPACRKAVVDALVTIDTTASRRTLTRMLGESDAEIEVYARAALESAPHQGRSLND